MATNLLELPKPKPANDHVKSLVAKVKPDLEREVRQTFSTFEAVSYWIYPSEDCCKRYYIKVRVGDDDHDYMHLRIFDMELEYQGHAVNLIAFRKNKRKDDEIEYFETSGKCPVYVI